MVRTIFITRSDISWYSKNANVQVRPRQLARDTKLTLCVNAKCRVPQDLAAACERVVVYRNLRELPTLLEGGYHSVVTGFDFPCMAAGLRLKKLLGIPWTMCLWDPPSLSHRDRFAPLRWAIDFVWRWFARRADKIILTIHPGLLDEMGYRPREGQAECHVQDAFEGLVPATLLTSATDYDVGILSNELPAKGSELVKEATSRLEAEGCRLRVVWVNGLPQEEAFAKLKKCRVLLAPYLPVRSLKWNYVLKLFEYLQIGRPILASDNPGNVYIAEKYAGRIHLFKSGNATDLAEKMKEMLCM